MSDEFEIDGHGTVITSNSALDKGVVQMSDEYEIDGQGTVIRNNSVPDKAWSKFPISSR